MGNKICKAIMGKSSQCSDCHNGQVASESIHGAELAVKSLQKRCNSCLEGNQDKNGDEKTIVDDANSSFSHACINMIGMLIGLGQLSTPYGLENGGWSSIFLLIGLGLVCAYSTLLLGKCLDKNPKSRSYTDIGQQAFGTIGRVIVSTFIYIEIFMSLVSYTISLHDNIVSAFFGSHIDLRWLNLTTPQVLTILAVLVALPSLWIRNLSSISFLSFGGIIMSAIIFLSVVFTAVFGGVKANHEIPILQLRKIPAVSGLYIFSFAGHIVFPNLYVAMKDPSKFKKVTIVSFTSVTTLYVITAFVGAKLFGPSVSPQITLSMPQGNIATRVAVWATVLTPMTKYALEFAPFALQMDRSFPAGPTTRALARGLVGSAAVLLILALALSVPFFDHVLALTGSLLSLAICVVFPCAFYVKISWSEISNPVLFLNLGFIGLGVFLGVLGTVSSSKSLIESLKRTSTN